MTRTPIIMNIHSYDAFFNQNIIISIIFIVFFFVDFVTTNSKGFGPSRGHKIPIPRSRGRRQGKEINVSSNSSLEVKLKKLYQANWEYTKKVSLIMVKQNENLVSVDKVDSKHMFESLIMKWKKIIATMNKDNHSIHMKNGLRCKDNQVAIYGNKSNQMYGDLSLQDKVALNLPKSINKKLYEMKMGAKPIFWSPHTRDLMNHVDKFSLLQYLFRFGRN